MTKASLTTEVSTAVGRVRTVGDVARHLGVTLLAGVVPKSTTVGI